MQRHIHATRKKRAQEDIRRIDSSESIIKFDEFENRIEQMEANADLINYGKKRSLEQQIDELLTDDDIERELEKLKSKDKDDKPTPPA